MLPYGMVTLHSGFSEKVQAHTLFYLLAFYLYSHFLLAKGESFVLCVFLKTTGLRCRSGEQGGKGYARNMSPLVLGESQGRRSLCIRAQTQQLADAHANNLGGF